MTWVLSMLAMLIAAAGTAPETDAALPDSVDRSDSLVVDDRVPLDLLQHLDLLLDLEFLEYADAFGDADVSSLVEPDSVATGGT